MAQPRPLYSEKLQKLPHVGHGFLTREGGVSQGLYASLNMGIARTDDPSHVQENWRRAASCMGLPADHLVMPRLVHGAEVYAVEAPFKMPDLEARPEADALVTKVLGLGIGVTSADCVPLLLAARSHPLVAAVHAGWKGALAGVVENTVQHFLDHGVKAGDIIAAVGPCIHQESYEVGEDVRAAFLDVSKKGEAFFKSHQASRKTFLFDLPGFVMSRLEDLGVREIDLLPHNTYTDEKHFFSCRRAAHQGQKNFGVQLSAIYTHST